MSRREESSLIHLVMCTLGSLTPDSESGAVCAENDAFAASVAGYGSHAPEVLCFGRFAFRSARRQENIADDAARLSQLIGQLPQTRATSVWQCIISG